jgi:hypothetical protein
MCLFASSDNNLFLLIMFFGFVSLVGMAMKNPAGIGKGIMSIFDLMRKK